MLTFCFLAGWRCTSSREDGGSSPSFVSWYCSRLQRIDVDRPDGPSEVDTKLQTCRAFIMGLLSWHQLLIINKYVKTQDVISRDDTH